MKKYCFTITSLLVLVMGITSCSNEENKTQNQVALRPNIPIMANEVQIGTQIWMTKNLNVSRYRNGDPIPQVTSPTQWQNLTTGAWCYYDNDPANGSDYGKLYNCYAVNDPRGLAPSGWHVPSDTEWTILTTFLGGEVVAGGKMKATTGWIPYSTITNTNSSGFTGLPGGQRSSDGVCRYIGQSGYWWSSSQGTLFNRAWIRFLWPNVNNVYRNDANNWSGFSVRCIKD